MFLFDFLKRKKKIYGAIGFYGLEAWWQSDFSEKERKRILDKYQPLGLSDSPLIQGKHYNENESAVKFLSGMSAWFSTQPDRPIAYKLLGKAESLIDQNTQVLDKHFFYEEKINIFYKDRELIQGHLEKAMEACEKQISFSPKAAKAFKDEFKGKLRPGHRGFQQLAIVKEKQKQFEKVIALCEQALSEDWSGDWEHRMNRCRKKMQTK